MWQTPENVTESKALHNRSAVFQDRRHAGQALTELLDMFRDSNAVVMAIPAGGVPVAVAVAGALGLSLGLLVVSKITLPWNPEAGFGAVAADGTHEINQALVQQLALDAATIEQGIEKTRAKVAHREQVYRQLLPPVSIEDRKVILVDDGIASGFTLRVAIAAAKHQHASEIIVAIPTGHAGSVVDVAQYCSRVYCANVREGMRFAVADAYEDWHDVSEAEVEDALKLYHRQAASQ